VCGAFAAAFTKLFWPFVTYLYGTESQREKGAQGPGLETVIVSQQKVRKIETEKDHHLRSIVEI